MPVLEMRDITKRFDATTVLSEFSLRVGAGQALCLFGPSGCGKTTALRIAARLERPDSGEVSVDGNRVNGVGETLPPGPGTIGMVFQDLALWPHLRALHQIDFVLRATGLTSSQRAARAESILETCALSGLERAFPAGLSGGEQQRLAIARALAPNPPLLLLDEPLANLDEELRVRFLAEFQRRKENGAAILFATHNRMEAETLADDILFLHKTAQHPRAPSTVLRAASPQGA